VTATAADEAGNTSAASGALSFTTSGASGSVVWPQSGAYLLAGQTAINNASTLQYLQHMNFLITAAYEGFDGGGHGTMAAATTSAQNNSVQPNGTLVLADIDAVVMNANTCTTELVANNMNLRATYPSGASQLVGSNYLGNICATPATSPPTFQGRVAYQYLADFSYDYLVAGGTLGLAQGTNVANPTLNGFYLDDFHCFVNYAGDWLRTGTEQSADSGSPPGNTAASVAFRTGWADLIARLKANLPGALVFCNLSGFYLETQVQTGLTGVFDGGVCEHAMGTSNSFGDGFGNWASLMQFCTVVKGFVKTGGNIMLNHDNVLNNGSDYYRPGAGQATRYGLATALMSQMAYNPIPPAGNVQTATNAPDAGDYSAGDYGVNMWFDELSVNPTTLVAVQYGASNIGQCTGWMGTEIDTGVVTAVWQNGCIRKRYQMIGGRQCWVILNPGGNGSQTLALGQAMQSFTASGASNAVPSVNNGAKNFTSITIPAYDARFLITYP
jgi:hypothetical protein